MDCQIRRSGDAADVVLTGSLDSSWSPFLADRLDEVIRAGVQEVRLDITGISYLSSNGIALLVRYHRQLRQIGGSFRVVGDSEAVGRVLELTGVAKLLREDRPVSQPRSDGTELSPYATIDRPGMTLQVYRQASSPAPVVDLGLIGDPTKLFGAGYSANDERCWRATPGGVAFGLGALGPDFEACRDRYGEFLAVGGVAVYRPSAGPGRPDFEQASGAFVPEVRVLHGLTFTVPATAGLVRFEAKHESESRPVPLSELARACLDESGAETVGMILTGETEGLVGAALRRSPAGFPPGTDAFAPAEARDWFSMTPEPEHVGSTALAVGVATRAVAPNLAPFVRPLSRPDSPDLLHGHFHAAAVPFRPLPRGRFEMVPTVRHLFEAGRVETVLHLLNDSRAIVGAGESTFRRGTFWFVPLAVTD